MKNVDWGVIFDQNPAALVVLDEVGMVVKVNESFRNWISGAESFEGKKLEDISRVISSEPDRDPPQEIRTISTYRNDSVLVEMKYREIEFDGKPVQLATVRDLVRTARCENRLTELLNTAPSAIMIVNQAGEIEFHNRRAEEVFGYDSGELKGKTIETLVPEKFRNQHATYREGYFSHPVIRPMGSGLELFGQRKDGTEFPVDISLGPLEEDGETKVLTIVRDITHHKTAQKELEQEKNFIRLLHELSVADDRAENVKDLVDVSVRKISRYMGWPVGHAYLPAEDGTGQFLPSNTWFISDQKRFAAFKSVTLQTRFRSGEGMVGKVIRDGKPVWLENCQEDPEFVRRFNELDLKVRTCIGFPILVEGKTEGVLEFFTDRIVAKDKILIQKLSTIGMQVGRVIERMKSRAALERSEIRFRTLFDSIHDAILITDGRKWINCNRSGEELFGCSCDEVAGCRLDNLLGRVEPPVSDLILRSMDGEHIRTEWTLPEFGEEGTALVVEVDIVPLKLNGDSLAVVMMRDITERKLADKLVRKNYELFNQLFNNSPIGVVMLNERGEVEDANSSFEQLFGYSILELSGKEIEELIVPEELIPEAKKLSARIFDGETFQVESRRLRKDGKVVPVLIGGVPVHIDGETIAIFGMYTDISERVKSEKKIKLSLREKETLLAEIHHRVKNNFALVTSLLELQYDTISDPGVRQAIRDSQGRIKSMSLVHEQLYQIGTFSALKLDHYIKSLTDTLVSACADPEKEIELIIDTEPVELEMEQAVPCGLFLSEVITNAYKHAFKGRDRGKVVIELQNREEFVRLKIADNGIGIPPDYKPDLNRSLGMTLIRELSEQLSGSLKVDNEGGTTILLEFMVKKGE